MHAMVTGGTGSLGGAVVHTFLEAGYSVYAVGRRKPEQVRNTHLHWGQYDLASPEAAPQLIEDALRQFGPLDAIIHTMGAFAGGAPVEETDDKTWNTMLATNLYSSFYLFRAALRAMRPRNYGRLLAVGSRTAVNPAPNLSAYTVSKAGLQTLVETIALETKGTGITANIVLPGTIDTPANRRAMPGADASQWVKPESIAKLLLWLASPEAADVNGAAIPVYGKS